MSYLHSSSRDERPAWEGRARCDREAGIDPDYSAVVLGALFGIGHANSVRAGRLLVCSQHQDLAALVPARMADEGVFSGRGGSPPKHRQHCNPIASALTG